MHSNSERFLLQWQRLHKRINGIQSLFIIEVPMPFSPIPKTEKLPFFETDIVTSVFHAVHTNIIIIYCYILYGLHIISLYNVKSFLQCLNRFNLVQAQSHFYLTSI